MKLNNIFKKFIIYNKKIYLKTLKYIYKITNLLCIIIFFNYSQLSVINKNKYSDKWIVMVAFNNPTLSFKNLINSINNWKIVVISTTKNIRINKSWKSLNFI